LEIPGRQSERRAQSRVAHSEGGKLPAKRNGRQRALKSVALVGFMPDSKIDPSWALLEPSWMR
jgi:hypothetical protein